jgi:hypothetical protein
VIAGGIVGMMARDKEERVPHSAIASVTLTIAREFLREIVVERRSLVGVETGNPAHTSCRGRQQGYAQP